MTKARRNPIGLPASDSSVTLVRVGKGEHTHLWDPELPIVIGSEVVGTGIHLCQSGKNAGRGGPSGATTNPRFANDARYVTCYRCAKIGSMNQKRYASFLRPRGG